MKFNKVIIISTLIFMMQGCKINPAEHYNNKGLTNIQKHCEDSVRTWVGDYAAFPESYIPLGFEKVSATYSHWSGVEIIPLRRYTLEHTFVIRTNDNSIKHVTLVFELTPDYFIQDVRYKQENIMSLLPRIFPPHYQLLTEFYGRPLTKSDTLRWSDNNRILFFELSEKLAFNRYINPEGENQALTDSLVDRLNNLYTKK